MKYKLESEKLTHKDWIVLALPIVLGLGSGLLVSRSKIPTSKYNPPPWVFMTVWPILYALMGYSSYLVYKSKNINRDEYLKLFYIHLGALILWWPIFVYFPNKMLALGSLVAIALIAAYIATKFYLVDKTAAYCLIPYLLWLCVASFLTYKSRASA
jgi:tryptophan-rich sensory protein